MLLIIMFLLFFFPKYIFSRCNILCNVRVTRAVFSSLGRRRLDEVEGSS